MRAINQGAAALAMAWLAATGAAAENITAKDPGALAEIMKGFGFPAEMQTDSQGDPKIRSETEGTEFDVLFYGCDAGKDCDYILFQAYFSSTSYSLKDADDWNGIGIYGFVSVGDSTNPALATIVNLSAGGVDKTNFEDTLARWTRSVATFKERNPDVK